MISSTVGALHTLTSNEQNGIYRIEIKGSGTVADMALIISEVTAFSDTRFELWVTNDVIIEASNNDLASLADVAKNLPNVPKKVALVANNDFLYGLCRVYAGRRETEFTEVSVFRNEVDAQQWLLPPC